MTGGRVHQGDCLTVMADWPDESVDLVYADPPFGPGAPFSDCWTGTTVDDFVEWMRPRVVEMRRLLKPSGSLYLHCDPTASHYLKVMMDTIFGRGNFRNEIIWTRTTAHSLARQHHARVHDTILYYSRGSTYTWNQLYTPYETSYIQAKYRHIEQGTGRRYRLDNTTAKGNTPYEVLGVKRPYRFSPENMNRLIEDGRIIQTKPGTVPQYVRYLDEMPGVLSQDVWLDVRPLNSQSKERLGYPTQKPLALLDRIVKASTNPGDLVLDPFCGSGTTLVAAMRLGRRWIGIDQSPEAVAIARDRLDPAIIADTVPPAGLW